MDNFDLKKFLTENKLTSVTRLAEKTKENELILFPLDIKDRSSTPPNKENELILFPLDINDKPFTPPSSASTKTTSVNPSPRPQVVKKPKSLNKDIPGGQVSKTQTFKTKFSGKETPRKQAPKKEMPTADRSPMVRENNSGENFAQGLGRRAFEKNPNIPRGREGDRELSRLAGMVGMEVLMSEPNAMTKVQADKLLRYHFSYNEDFIPDLFQYYRDLQKENNIEHGFLPGYDSIQENNLKDLSIATEIVGEEFSRYIQKDTIEYWEDESGDGGWSISFDLLVPADYGYTGRELEKNLSYQDSQGPGQWFTKVMASAGMEDENGNTLVTIFGRAGYNV